jgi:phage baseplate assembly protein W
MALQKLKLSRIYKDIDLSFTANALSGDIGKKFDVNAVKQSVKSLLLTKPHEKFFHPEKGSGLDQYLFEPMSPGLEISLSKTIELLISNYEPRCNILGIRVNANYDLNYYTVTLRFRVIGINQPQELTVNLTRLR